MDNDNSTKRRALGRGLEELFSSEQIDFQKLENKIIEETKKDEIVNINLDDLRANPYQPRKYFDEEKLSELAESIKEFGVVQPIIVKKTIKGYEIIAGERRSRAAKIAGLTSIPAIIRDFNDEEMMQIALLENLQREDLNSIEEATAYKKLIDTLGITQDVLASKLGKSRSHVTNMLGLLVLPSEVKDLIVQNRISMSHARILSKMEDKEEILSLADKIVNEELNVRKLEELAGNPETVKRNKIKKHERSTEFKYLEDSLCEKLGTKVKIKNNKLEIKFVNINDLNRILEILNISE